MKALNFAAIAMLAFGAVAAQAANTVQLRGTIATVCTVAALPDPRALMLPITDGGEVVVGRIEENCNYAGGYTIKASSLNGSKLVNTVNSNLSTHYEVTLQDGRSDVALGTTPTMVRSVGAMNTAAVNVLKDVTLTVFPFPGALGGNYEDTITFTITAP